MVNFNENGNEQIKIPQVPVLQKLCNAVGLGDEVLAAAIVGRIMEHVSTKPIGTNRAEIGTRLGIMTSNLKDHFIKLAYKQEKSVTLRFEMVPKGLLVMELALATDTNFNIWMRLAPSQSRQDTHYVSYGRFYNGGYESDWFCASKVPVLSDLEWSNKPADEIEVTENPALPNIWEGGCDRHLRELVFTKELVGNSTWEEYEPWGDTVYDPTNLPVEQTSEDEDEDDKETYSDLMETQYYQMVNPYLGLATPLQDPFGPTVELNLKNVDTTVLNQRDEAFQRYLENLPEPKAKPKAKVKRKFGQYLKNLLFQHRFNRAENQSKDEDEDEDEKEQP